MQLIKSLPTLFNFEYTKFHQIKENSISILGIPFGNGNLRDPNCRKFPTYIRNYLYNRNIQLNNSSDYRCITTQISFKNLQKLINNNLIKDIGDLRIIFNEYKHHTYENIENLSYALKEAGSVPFIMGGDHSITLPIIKGCTQYHNSIQILNFDAHLDMSNSKKQEKLYNEGIVSHHFGNVMSECAKLKSVEHIIHFGIRDLINLRPNYSEKSSIFFMEELEILNGSVWECISTELPTYITFDIDFFDPQIAPGTAVPVINGARIDPTIIFLNSILMELNIIGIDLVEINPDLDDRNQTIQLASQLILVLLNCIKVNAGKF